MTTLEKTQAKQLRDALQAAADKRKAARDPLVAELANVNESLIVAEEQRRARFSQPSGVLIRVDDLDVQIARLKRRSDVISAALKKLDADIPVATTTREQLQVWW